MFLAELNNLELWATDVGNAYLESTTTENVYIVAGPEFGEREGHILIIRKALYGLKSSGQRWHDRLHYCMIDLGFTPCKAEPDIWMKRNGQTWEYVAVYVDDLAIAMKNPALMVSALSSNPYNNSSLLSSARNINNTETPDGNHTRINRFKRCIR
jgi:hypothetical protein